MTPKTPEKRQILPDLSGLGMGGWCFGGDYWGEQPGKISRKAIMTALSEGIHYFDTAPSYGRGKSEQIIGQTLRKNRSDITISSKFFPTLPENVYKGLKRSLRRLETSYLDVYFIHWPNDKCMMGGVMEELERARREGLIRSLGVSNFSVSQMEALRKYGTIDFCQTGYNLLWRYPEKELLPYCRKNKIKTIAYSPLAQGLLGNSRRKTVTADDNRRQLIFFRREELLNQVLDSFFKEVEKYGVTLFAAALGWILYSGRFTGIVGGMRTENQVRSLKKGAETPVSNELFKNLDAISLEYNRELSRAFPEAENIWDHRR